MNIKRTFKSAYAKIEPGEGFNEKTIRLMRQAKSSPAARTTAANGRRPWLMTTLKFGANILVILLVVHLIGIGIGNGLLPAATGGIPTAGPSTTQPTTSAASPTTTTSIVAADDVVVSRDYLQGELVDHIYPRPGDIFVNLGVQRALEDSVNQTKRFFVGLLVVPSDNAIVGFNQFIYNGRTIAEWRELVDLANGTYPYSEYNGDHGGNVTVEAWRQKQAEAKTLDAQTNLDQATDAYKATVTPVNNEKSHLILQAETARLTGLGCQVFIRQIKAEGQGLPNDEYPLLCGLLTADQLRHFPGLAEYGYMIDWVHDDNGVANWDG
jgi:hypothetical protein